MMWLSKNSVLDFEVHSEESILETRFERPHIIISVADVATYPVEVPPDLLCLGILRPTFYKGFYYFSRYILRIFKKG